MSESNPQPIIEPAPARRRNPTPDPFKENLRETINILVPHETHFCKELVQLGLDNYDTCPPNNFRKRLLAEDLPKARASEIKVILLNQEVARRFVAGEHGVLEALQLARGKPLKQPSKTLIKSAAAMVYTAFLGLLAEAGKENWEKDFGPLRLTFTPENIITS